MGTARTLPYRGSPWQRPALDRDPLDREPPRQRTPWTETPTPGQRPLPATPGQRPPHLDREPPLWTEAQTGIKTLPSRNFVAGGNETLRDLILNDTTYRWLSIIDTTKQAASLSRILCGIIKEFLQDFSMKRELWFYKSSAQSHLASLLLVDGEKQWSVSERCALVIV